MYINNTEVELTGLSIASIKEMEMEQAYPYIASIIGLFCLFLIYKKV